MTQYLISIIEPSGDGTYERPAPDVLEQIGKNLDAFHHELHEAGAWVFANGLHAPNVATMVRHRDGEAIVTDGPFMEGKEHIGGICIVEAADLDEAIGWADKASRATTLPVEVRPFFG